MTEQILDSRPDAELAPGVVGHLERCAACAQLWQAHAAAAATFAGLKAGASDRVRQAIAARLAVQPVSTPGWLERLRASSGWGVALAGAACVSLLFTLSGRDRIGYEARGSIRAGSELLATRGSLAPGTDSLELAEGTGLTLHPSPGDSVQIEGPGRVAVPAANRLELALGRASFDLGPQRAGYVVRVPAGEIRVLGTSFQVEVRPGAALVRSTRGRLELSPRAGPATVIEGERSVLLTVSGVVQEPPASLPVPTPAPTIAESSVPAQGVLTSSPQEPERTPRPTPTASITPVRGGRGVEGWSR